MRSVLSGMYKFSITLYGLFIMLLMIAGCGSNSGSSAHLASDTGSVTFSIVMSDSSSRKGGNLSNAVIDCSTEGIAEIEAEIYDQSDNLLKAGGPWACNAHEGTITEVPVGSNRWLKITGKDSGQDVRYRGITTTPFTVTTGQNNIGQITLNPLFSTQQKKIIASDAEDFDSFGESVSISGDYAIVGADLEDEGAADAGAAYILYRNEGGSDQWGRVYKVVHVQEDAGFGLSVAISGDYAIVGAWGDDTGGTDAGAAYIFYRNQGGANQWGEQKAITAEDVEASDRFGESVSISGDYAIVGAWGEDTGGTDAGAAYIFYRNQGGTDQWGQVAKLTATDSQADDVFGLSVSISGDYAIVGAPGEDTGGTDAGAAYIFYRNQGGTDQWGQVFKLYHSEINAALGVSVSISGDYAIAGASNDDVGSLIDAGAVHILYKNQNGTGQWGEQKAFTAEDVEASDIFGFAVSISGDYAIVGAPGEDTGGSDAGAGYLFYRNHGGTDQWGQIAKLTASDAQALDFFGWSVSISGDYAIVGADEEDEGASDAGAGYIYY